MESKSSIRPNNVNSTPNEEAFESVVEMSGCTYPFRSPPYLFAHSRKPDDHRPRNPTIGVVLHPRESDPSTRGESVNYLSLDHPCARTRLAPICNRMALGLISPSREHSRLAAWSRNRRESRKRSMNAFLNTLSFRRISIRYYCCGVEKRGIEDRGLPKHRS